MAAPRTQFYHPAHGIETAITGTERAIRRAEGVALVVGPPGTGKSLLLALVAERVRDDFDVALLSGARICTRRALWQAILAEIGEPYRGIDEAELRIALVERIRGLAATGSGLVVLVDEAQTLPTRLIEELRLLTNVPTPLPAVHIVLAGSTKLEELLGLPRMESFAQRIAVRSYLEPLDHAETVAYLRTQTKTAGCDWDALFAPGCDDAVFTATDGVPRLINQLCDHALVLRGDSPTPVTPAAIAAAWRDIQRLPAPTTVHHSPEAEGVSPCLEFGTDAAHEFDPFADTSPTDDRNVVEFGGFDDGSAVADDAPPPRAGRGGDPWSGPDVELVFDGSGDPFEEFFEQERDAVERFLMRGPDDFRLCQQVSSREGETMARQLADCERIRLPAVPPPADGSAAVSPPAGEETAAVECVPDDADMVVIEEDLEPFPPPGRPVVAAVRPGDYRSLFARLRRGDRGPATPGR
jgi:type II secretory pathway predicted ATPase ExeA